MSQPRNERKPKAKVALRADPPVRAGDTMLVFDGTLWPGRKDCFRKATILDLDTIGGTAEVATVRFHHSARESSGHYTYNMRPSP